MAIERILTERMLQLGKDELNNKVGAYSTPIIVWTS